MRFAVEPLVGARLVEVGPEKPTLTPRSNGPWKSAPGHTEIPVEHLVTALGWYSQTRAGLTAIKQYGGLRAPQIVSALSALSRSDYFLLLDARRAAAHAVLRSSTQAIRDGRLMVAPGSNPKAYLLV